MGLAIAYTAIWALPVFIINIDRLPTSDYPVEILAAPGDIIDLPRESMA